MQFKSFPIKGKGRGKQLGFPTINLNISNDFDLEDGIYAVWVKVNNIKYRGAMHYGPVPTFGEKDKSLEVYIIDSASQGLPLRTGKTMIIVEVVQRIRKVIRFKSAQELKDGMKKDVSDAIILLNE